MQCFYNAIVPPNSQMLISQTSGHALVKLQPNPCNICYIYIYILFLREQLYKTTFELDYCLKKTERGLYEKADVVSKDSWREAFATLYSSHHVYCDTLSKRKKLRPRETNKVHKHIIVQEVKNSDSIFLKKIKACHLNTVFQNMK